MSRIIKRVLVGERRWETLRKLPLADRVVSQVSPVCIPLDAVAVKIVPELEPDDAFVEYTDGSVERLA